MFFALVISLVFLQGCAIDKPFVKKDLATLSPLKVVRHKTPAIGKITPGGRFAGVVGFLLTGGLGATAAEGAAQKSAGKKAEENIPDFGYLVMKKFVDRASKEIPGWPEMIVIEQPVSDDYSEPVSLLKFKITHPGGVPSDLVYGESKGKGFFVSNTLLTLTDYNGDVLWQKFFEYYSLNFNRNYKNIDELEANNFKLLKEEIEFAAETTVSEFIKHFKGEK